MRTTASQILSYSAKNGRPLAGAPAFSLRPIHKALGWTAQQSAAFCLTTRDRNNLAALEARYAAACKALGAANRMKGPMRRRWVAEAFRGINSARAQLRAARKALVISEAAALALALPVAS